MINQLLNRCKMTPRTLRVSKEFAWIILGKIIVVISGLIGVRVLTGLLPPEIYGQIALCMTAVGFVQLIVMGPLAQSIVRFFSPARESNRLKCYLLAVCRLTAKASVCVILATFVVGLTLFFFKKLYFVGLITAVLFFSLLSGYNSILCGIQNAARQRVVVSMHQALVSVLSIILAALLILWLGRTSTVTFAGYVLSLGLVLISQIYFLKRLVSSHKEKIACDNNTTTSWDNQMFHYSWPFAIWGLFSWLNLSSSRWALQSFLSIREVGVYAALYRLGYYPVTFISGLFTQLFDAILYQRAGDASNLERIKNVYKIVWIMTLAGCVITILIVFVGFCFHEEIFRLLVAPEYRRASVFLPLMLLSGGLVSMSGFSATAIKSHFKVKALVLPKCIVHSLGVILNILGAYWYGMKGVVSALVVYSFFLFMTVVFISIVHYKNFEANR